MSGPSSSKQLRGDVISTDPVTVHSLAVKSSVPSGREGHCSCAIGDKLYVFGGVCKSKNDDDFDESDELLMLDIGPNTWQTVAASGECPRPRSAAVLNAVGKKLYLFGGLSQFTGWFSDVHVFDTENSNWVKLTTSGNAPSGRDKLGSAVIGDTIYYFGGFGPKGGLNDLDEDDDDYTDTDEDEDDEIREVKQEQKAADFGWFNDLYIFNTITFEWSQPMQMNLGVPTMRAAHGVCSVGQYLIIFGGRGAEGRLNDIHVFDTVCRKWWLDIKEKGSPPDRRSFHTITSLNNELAMVFGGRSESNDHFQDCHVFSLTTCTWYSVPMKTAPLARGCHTSTFIAGKVVIYAGSAQFSPEMQHCHTVYNDTCYINVQAVVDVVNARVQCNGH